MKSIKSIAELNGWDAFSRAVDEFTTTLCPYEEVNDPTSLGYTFMCWLQEGTYGLTADGHWFEKDEEIS